MNNRVTGFDLARAFAILGMVIVNFKTVMGSDTGAEWLKFTSGLLEGRAAALFVILAGVGVSLMTRDARESTDHAFIIQKRKILIKRAVLLFLVGLSYSFIWPADILHFYGLYILTGAFFITSSDRTLKVMSSVFTFVFVIMLFFIDYETGWNWETLNYSGFYTVAGMIRHLFYNGFHPVFPWAAFLFIGMWLGRQDVLKPEVRQRILIYSIAIAFASELFSWLAVNYILNNLPAVYSADLAALFGTKPMPPVPLYITAAGGTAVAIIILSIILTEKLKDSEFLRPLIYTGQLALSMYVAHVVIGMGTLYLMGRLFNQTITFAVFSASIFNLSAIIFSYLWRKRFKTGPLELIFRKLSGSTLNKRK